MNFILLFFILFNSFVFASDFSDDDEKKIGYSYYTKEKIENIELFIEKCTIYNFDTHTVLKWAGDFRHSEDKYFQSLAKKILWKILDTKDLDLEAYSKAYLSLAKITQKEGNPFEAIELLKKSDKLNPNYAATQELLGQFYAHLSINCDWTDDAIKWNKKAIKTAKHSLKDIKANTFWPLPLEKEHEVYAKNLENKKVITRSYLGLGGIYSQKKNDTKSLKYYKKAGKKSSKMLEKYKNLHKKNGFKCNIPEIENLKEKSEKGIEKTLHFIEKKKKN